MSQHTVTLAGEIDLPGFRREARALLASLVPPEETDWHARTDAAVEAAKGGRTVASATRAAPAASNLFLPRSFLSLCETVILHNDPSRFVLLYRLLWRLVHEPDLRRNPLDSDRMRALHMAQAVRRDMQKMKSLIHFKVIDEEGGEPLQIGWFEPDHHIVEAIAPFFARRLVKAHWAILTPECSVRRNAEALEFGPGLPPATMPSEEAAPDAWLARYRQVFSLAPLQIAPRQQVQGSDAQSA